MIAHRSGNRTKETLTEESSNGAGGSGGVGGSGARLSRARHVVYGEIQRGRSIDIRSCVANGSYALNIDAVEPDLSDRGGWQRGERGTVG